jgi:hypothetical protein
MNRGSEVTKMPYLQTLPSNINYVKGWSNKNIIKISAKNKTPEDCRQMALESKGKYAAWGYRTDSYPDPLYKNTCFLYKTPFEPYPGNIMDNSHLTGCVNPGEKVELGCVVPSSKSKTSSNYAPFSPTPQSKYSDYQKQLDELYKTLKYK